MRRFFSISLLFLSAFSVKAQEQDFSQFLLSSLYMNPAYASAYTDFAVNMNYRMLEVQGSTIQSSQVSLVFPLKLDNITENVAGFGLSAFNQDVDGVLKENGLYLTYAQNFTLGLLGSDLIAVGIQGGFSRSSIEFSNLTWGSQFSGFVEDGINREVLGPNQGQGAVTEFDAAINRIGIHAGAMYYYNRKRNYLLHNYSAFSGIAIYNINRPNNAFSLSGNTRDPLIIKYHGGMEVRAGNLYVLPNALVYYSNGSFDTIVGSHFALSFISTARFTSANQGFQLLFGSWYRLRQSFSFLGGLQYNALAIRASYDLNADLLVDSDAYEVAPAYEISLTYLLGNSGNLRKINNALF